MASNTRMVAARRNTVLAWCHRGLGTIAFMSLAGGCIGLALGQFETTPRHLDDGRQWLDLPAAATASSPTLIRAAAASAVGDGVTAERLLRSIIRARPLSDDAGEAHELLSRLYLRSGQYDRLFRNFDAWERNFPNSPAVREERTDIEFLRGLPDQRNGSTRISRLTHEAGDDFSVPVTANGKTARYLLDTGAWFSLITAGEAKRLGLRVRPATGRIGDASGNGVSVRTAVVDDLRLGSMRFRQVSFVVLDTEEQAGILGVPVLLATGRVDWSVGGTWELGGRSEPHARAANLVFFENKLLLALTAFGRQVFGTLDTGAVSTDLNSNFEDQFREQIQGQGTVGAGTIEGVGRTASFQMLTLPEVAFAIDRTPVTLRPARVMRQRIAGVGGACCVGNVGRDLLTQHGELVIDFSEMTLSIRVVLEAPRCDACVARAGTAVADKADRLHRLTFSFSFRSSRVVRDDPVEQLHGIDARRLPSGGKSFSSPSALASLVYRPATSV